MKASLRAIAEKMDSIRPPYRLRGSSRLSYEQNDEDLWLHGGATAKQLAEYFGLYHAFNKGLFQVHQGSPVSFREVTERHRGSRSTSHRLLVYNTYLITGYVLYSASEREARAMDIGRMIKREKYDIVCLCEVFNRDDGIRIRDRVGNSASQWAEAFGPDSSLRNISGGLYGLVKKSGRQLVDYKNALYSDGGEGWDEFANKGWLLMEIDLGPGTIDIFSTHTDADVEDALSREGQISELIRAIRQRQEEYPEHVTMAVGDFNVYSSEHEYVRLLERMWEDCSMRDVWLTRGGKASATHAFASKCTNSGPPDCACDDYVAADYGGDRLDYVFVQEPQTQHDMILDMARMRRRPFPRAEPCGDVDPRELAEDEEVYMSDHVGLQLEIIASPRSSHS